MSEATVTVPVVVTVKVTAEHDEITVQQMHDAILENYDTVACGVAKALGLSHSSSQVEIGWVDEDTSFAVTDLLEVDILPVSSTSEDDVGDIIFYTKGS